VTGSLIWFSFYDEQLSAPRPNSKLDDHPLSAVRDCLLNAFVVTIPAARFVSVKTTQDVNS
jgi:hypothetical protein